MVSLINHTIKACRGGLYAGRPLTSQLIEEVAECTAEEQHTFIHISLRWCAVKHPSPKALQRVRSGDPKLFVHTQAAHSYGEQMNAYLWASEYSANPMFWQKPMVLRRGSLSCCFQKTLSMVRQRTAPQLEPWVHSEEEEICWGLLPPQEVSLCCPFGDQCGLIHHASSTSLACFRSHGLEPPMTACAFAHPALFFYSLFKFSRHVKVNSLFFAVRNEKPTTPNNPSYLYPCVNQKG